MIGESIMKPYDKARQVCKYGHFDMDKPASYTLTNRSELKGPWYYIYSNQKVLLYVDQNGPVKVQYQPPNGILVFKRETGENQSKWQVWISGDDLNGGVPVTNFGTPSLSMSEKEPECIVNWSPEKAVYTVKYDNADIITEIFVPRDKATVCMKTTIVNTSGKKLDLSAVPAMFPYVNVPQMVPWDLAEWYLSTGIIHRGEMLTLHGQMTDPLMNKADNRSVTFNIDYDDNAELELNMAEFAVSGNFFSPERVKKGVPLEMKMNDADGEGFSAFQAVYAARYKFSLEPNESKTLTQVLTIQEDTSYNEEENLFDKVYFDKDKYSEYVEKTRMFYEELFNKRTVKTSNQIYDNFINSFTPLQMYWVGSLDRGWPSSMRGVRDASQDFIGITPLDPGWTRETILNLFRHQQKDGWMPRQVSTVSREAPHDMRYYCDGGAFLLELIHEYMTFTRDTSILDEKLVWLDSDDESTVLEHIIRCTQFYLEDNNIGEHGLCKVWYGDWWDPMDKIGMDGIGESVTVTAQMILNLKNLSDMYRWLVNIGKIDETYLNTAEIYLVHHENFIKAMREHAYNSKGFFNGYYNDNRKWLLSEKDPDGEKRVYLVSNSWALICGCATEEMQKSVIDNIEKECLGRVGYNTNSKGFPVYIDKAGRKGNGTTPGVNPYNHAQSFFVRGCCECGDAETAYKATRYILPIEEEYAPVEMTYAPPYAIANMYKNSDKFPHRVELQFLSGTVSYVLRIVYNFFFGITYGYEGLTLKPCIPEAFGDCRVKFTYLGKGFDITYIKTDSGEKTVTFNGEKYDTQISESGGKMTAYFPDRVMKEENVITFEY